MGRLVGATIPSTRATVTAAVVPRSTASLTSISATGKLTGTDCATMGMLCSLWVLESIKKDTMQELRNQKVIRTIGVAKQSRMVAERHAAACPECYSARDESGSATYAEAEHDPRRGLACGFQEPTTRGGVREPLVRIGSTITRRNCSPASDGWTAVSRKKSNKRATLRDIDAD